MRRAAQILQLIDRVVKIVHQRVCNVAGNSSNSRARAECPLEQVSPNLPAASLHAFTSAKPEHTPLPSMWRPDT
jgi:hypothetical protein